MDFHLNIFYDRIIYMSKNAIKRIMQKDMKSIQVHNLEEMGIYIEFNEENMLEALAMIKGPDDSVYKNGLLFFKIKFPDNYPFSPPHVSYVSRGSLRIHPNLYTGYARDNYLGKVCLSILGTWSGPGWTTIMDISSVLISIQSLLDKNPLDHEPGFSGKKSMNHTLYANAVEYENFRTLITKNILDTPEEFMCFKDIINKHYISNKSEIIKDMDEIMKVLKKHKRRGITIPMYRINLELRYDLLKKQLEI